ncbi:3-keto-steroid reductase/17-beta-hydroxysteroid dehydrogenase 7-like isoform X2 [Mya arenaria]|uniref:3-keto-steroid reductase/17-beta-hydroxysteroid dehydrogenase 7-like isoform X2 n=1 Tax=Mya arenaria TaxID=6604 RepID=UPI0022E20B88|nr:3-keto-steroid reductase/17-beta-hydroxysteroid dehydrogenase 7-like isoform X2 [Mya arenaria]
MEPKVVVVTGANAFKHIDLLYLNAGIMKVSSINIKKVLTIFHDFRREGAEILSTGKGVLNHINNMTDEGLQEVFATNIFGHYVLVRELQDCCLGSPQSQIVWTSSQNAEAGVFNFQDIQHKHGKEPYSSSKHATDILSVALNSRLNEKGVYSTVTCPGLVMSNIVFAILPAWFWWIVMPFLYFMRFFVPNLSCSAYNGAEALIWVSKQRLASLNPRIKYLSHCSVFGKRFIAEEKLHVSDDDADSVYNELEKLYQGFKHQYEQANIIHSDQSFSGCLHNEQSKEQIANGWH